MDLEEDLQKMGYAPAMGMRELRFNARETTRPFRGDQGHYCQT